MMNILDYWTATDKPSTHRCDTSVLSIHAGSEITTDEAASAEEHEQ